MSKCMTNKHCLPESHVETNVKMYDSQHVIPINPPTPKSNSNLSTHIRLLRLLIHIFSFQFHSIPFLFALRVSPSSVRLRNPFISVEKFVSLSLVLSDAGTNKHMSFFFIKNNKISNFNQKSRKSLRL